MDQPSGFKSKGCRTDGNHASFNVVQTSDGACPRTSPVTM